jgi:cytochrome c
MEICHILGKEEEHNTETNLHSLFGQKTGRAIGLSYTDDKNKGITWGEETLMGYLENPQKYMPETRVIFIGAKEKGGRKDLIDYLRKTTNEKYPLLHLLKKRSHCFLVNIIFDLIYQNSDYE